MAAAARPNHLLCWRTQASFDATIRRAFVLGLETDAKTSYAVDRATTADFTGAVRRRQGFVSRRGVDRPRRSGADARCAPRVVILCRSGSVPGSRVSARSFGPCARPGSRLARASVATGRPTAVLAVVSARHAPVYCSLVIHVPRRARAETANLASVSITGACARQISWGIGVLQPPRCPWPHQRHASRRSRPRHAAIFCPRTRARARRRPLSSRVIDFGDRDGGVSPEDASGAAGRGGDRAINPTGEHTRAKPRALPARPRPCHPAHTRPIVLSNDPPNAGAAAKIFFCSRAPFARPVVRRGPAHPTPTPAPPPRAPRPNPVAGASFPTSRLRAQRRGSIGRRSKPPRLRDRAEHRDDFCLLGAHPAEHGARSGRSQSHVPVGTHIGRRTRPRWVWVGVQSRGPLFGRRRGGRALAAAGPVPELALDLRSALGESDSPRPAWWVIRCWGPPGLVWVFAGGGEGDGRFDGPAPARPRPRLRSRPRACRPWAT